MNKISPKIMGVINITPDSFYRESRCQNVDQAVKLAELMHKSGADIIDIGGEATHPKLDVSQSQVSVQEELDRVVNAIEIIKANVPICISLDSSKPKVMEAAVKAGADMINDQRALSIPGALEMAAKLQVPVCLMHMYGLNRKPYDNYGLTLQEVKSYLEQRIKAALDVGIKPERIIIDPGFGYGNYGKSTSENLYMLKNLEQFVEMGYPVMVGLSRKTLIGEVLSVPVEERLAGSLCLAILAAIKGAQILRVHDVKDSAEAIKMLMAVQTV